MPGKCSFKEGKCMRQTALSLINFYYCNNDDKQGKYDSDITKTELNWYLEYALFCTCNLYKTTRGRGVDEVKKGRHGHNPKWHNFIPTAVAVYIFSKISRKEKDRIWTKKHKIYILLSAGKTPTFWQPITIHWLWGKIQSKKNLLSQCSFRWEKYSCFLQYCDSKYTE